jgi:branched-chain amino acid transport system permease protein
MKRDLLWIVALLSLFLLLSPGDFYTNFVTRVLIASILAFSLNMMLGDAGLMSLSQSAFGGIAAYGIAWFAAVQGLGHLPAAISALLITTVVAGAYGAVALRVQGIGFLMITLALGQITWGLAQRWVAVTGGENGITGLKRPAPFGVSLDSAGNFYVFTAIIFLAIYFVLSRAGRSYFGATVRGTRDQSRRMSALGYNVWLIRWLTFTFAGFLAAVAGVLDAYYNKFASPNFLSLTEAAAALLMVIVGGSSVLLGPVCGAVLVLLLTQVASSYTEHWVGLLGVLFLFIVLFMPDGILPFVWRVAGNARSRLFVAKRVEEPASIPARTT